MELKKLIQGIWKWVTYKFSPYWLERKHFSPREWRKIKNKDYEEKEDE